MDIAALRKDYTRAALDETHCAADPNEQFSRWLQEALSADLPEPTAMALSTVSSDRRPSTRMVLLKGNDARGFSFFTNYDSRKGEELGGNPYASLLFFWPELERQVRIEGKVERLSAEESDAYYDSRPLTSRIGAWASPQSRVLESRAWLVAQAAALATRHGMHPPRPPHWGGYLLRPDYFEFWQGRPSRLHDRVRYVAEQGGWRINRLAP